MSSGMTTNSKNSPADYQPFSLEGQARSSQVYCLSFNPLEDNNTMFDHEYEQWLDAIESQFLKNLDAGLDAMAKDFEQSRKLSKGEHHECT